MNTLPKLHIMICCNWRRRYLSGLAVRTEEIDGPDDVAVKCENTGSVIDGVCSPQTYFTRPILGGTRSDPRLK
jgi:hypothetical protein